MKTTVSVAAMFAFLVMIAGCEPPAPPAKPTPTPKVESPAATTPDSATPATPDEDMPGDKEPGETDLPSDDAGPSIDKPDAEPKEDASEPKEDAAEPKEGESN